MVSQRHALQLNKIFKLGFNRLKMASGKIHVVTIDQKKLIWRQSVEALEIAIDKLYQEDNLTRTASETAEIIKNFIEDLIKRFENIQKKIEYKPFKRLMGPPPPPPKI